MDKDVAESRRKAIDALAVAIGFWGVDPLEARVYGTLFLSPRPLSLEEMTADLGNVDHLAVVDKIFVLERLGAVKEMDGETDSMYYEAVPDFFEILQTVLKERRERELGNALQEISDQKAYIEYRFEEDNNPELQFIAGRLERLEKFIHIIDKAMAGLKAFAGIRGMFRGRQT